MSSTIPKADAVEAKRRAEWLHKHKAHKDWIILSVSEVAVIRDELLILERERDEAREQAQRLRVQLNHYTQANEMAEQAFRERDESHKIAKRAIDDLAWFNQTNAQRLRNELDQLKEATK